MPKGTGKKIPRVKVNENLTKTDAPAFLAELKLRFEANMTRHQNIPWQDIAKKLEQDFKKLQAIYAMEMTGGEPDVILLPKQPKKMYFVDCSTQTPDRRSICYDREAEKLREKKGLFPGGNAVDLAETLGVDLLDENQYRQLQEFGEFDTTTSSWIKTPAEIRKLGGALFCDRRYDTVFTYHNGAESFYGARGFRGILEI